MDLAVPCDTPALLRLDARDDSSLLPAVNTMFLAFLDILDKYVQKVQDHGIYGGE